MGAGGWAPRAPLTLTTAFYVATLCKRKRGLCCRPMSVRPSLTFVYCIQMAKGVVKLLSRPGSPIILVFFLTSSAGTQFKGFSGGAKYTGDGVEKFVLY